MPFHYASGSPESCAWKRKNGHMCTAFMFPAAPSAPFPLPSAPHRAFTRALQRPPERRSPRPGALRLHSPPQCASASPRGLRFCAPALCIDQTSGPHLIFSHSPLLGFAEGTGATRRCRVSGCIYITVCDFALASPRRKKITAVQKGIRILRPEFIRPIHQ